MVFRPATFGSLLIAVSFFGLGIRVVFGDNNDKNSKTVDCQEYTDARFPNATCNGFYKCTGGCTQFVHATKCTRSQVLNDLKPPLTTENCTIAYGKSSATINICNNEKGSFTCYGAPEGTGVCNGCSNDPNQQSSNNTSPHPGDNHNGKSPAGKPNGGSGTTTNADNKDPNDSDHSSGSVMRINTFFLSLSTLISATFL